MSECLIHGWRDDSCYSSAPPKHCPSCTITILREAKEQVEAMYNELYVHHANEKHSGEMFENDKLRTENAILREALKECKQLNNMDRPINCSNTVDEALNRAGDSK